MSIQNLRLALFLGLPAARLRRRLIPLQVAGAARSLAPALPLSSVPLACPSRCPFVTPAPHSTLDKTSVPPWSDSAASTPLDGPLPVSSRVALCRFRRPLAPPRSIGFGAPAPASTGSFWLVLLEPAVLHLFVLFRILPRPDAHD